MITQLLASSFGAETPSFIIVGGGGGAIPGGADGLGGSVLNGQFSLLTGTYSVVVGAGGSRGGGLGSSSSFNNFVATGSTRTTTVQIDSEVFSGVDQGSPNSLIKGSGALASSIIYTPGYCVGVSSFDQQRCLDAERTWISATYTNGNGNNGVVILTIPTSLAASIIAIGATPTVSGSNTIYRYTFSGSFQVL